MIGKYTGIGLTFTIFHYMALEEKAIRQDPIKRTTQLLQKVFN